MKTTANDYRTISKIAQRALHLFEEAGIRRDYLSVSMDIETVHEQIGLRLDDLLHADDANFAHDVFGIFRHLNRDTKQLEDFFLPRFAVDQNA
jgi:hypothetical protein